MEWLQGSKVFPYQRGLELGNLGRELALRALSENWQECAEKSESLLLCKDIELAGALERTRTLFKYKNEWADRARKAEAESERLNRELQNLSNQLADCGTSGRQFINDMKAIIGLLEEREWAEHCTKTRLGKRLEQLITELHGEAAQPAPVNLPKRMRIEGAAYCTARAYYDENGDYYDRNDLLEALKAQGVEVAE